MTFFFFFLTKFWCCDEAAARHSKECSRVEVHVFILHSRLNNTNTDSQPVVSVGIFRSQHRGLENLPVTRPRQPRLSVPAWAEELMEIRATVTGKLLIWLCGSTGTFPSSRIMDGFRGKTVAEDINSNEQNLHLKTSFIHFYIALGCL